MLGRCEHTTDCSSVTDIDILDAASKGQLEMVKRFLETGRLNAKSLFCIRPCFNSTPLAEASQNGHADVVKELIPFYHEATNVESGFPVHAACWNGHVDCVRMIVTHLPHLLDEQDEHGLSPIHIAAKTGHTEIANILLQAGADVNKRENIKYLKYGSYRNYTALYSAAAEGHTDIVRALLAHGADPLLGSKSDQDYLNMYRARVMLCPLTIATFGGHIEVLKILSKFVPLDQTYGTQAVVVAAIRQQINCLQYLLENGAPTFMHLEEYTQYHTWRSILMPWPNAELDTRIEVTKTLLDRGMTFFAIANLGNTEITILLANMPLSILKFLLDCGYFELRYHKYCNQRMFDQNDNLLTRIELAKCIRRDFNQIVGEFRSKRLGRNLETIVAHFPWWIGDLLLPLLSSSLDENIYDAVPPLLHLCRWTIRCSLLAKHNFISKDLIAKLNTAPRLHRYLFYK